MSHAQTAHAPSKKAHAADKKTQAAHDVEETPAEDGGDEATTNEEIAPIDAAPVVTSETVSIPLEQGVLVIADSSTFDETQWLSPHSHNVQNGWAVDLSGPAAEELAQRMPTWKKEKLDDGTWRIVVTNNEEANIIAAKILDLQGSNPEKVATVTVAPRGCSITRIRDAARGKGAAALYIGPQGGGGRQIVGASAPRHTNAVATIERVDGVAKKITITLPG